MIASQLRGEKVCAGVSAELTKIEEETNARLDKIRTESLLGTIRRRLSGSASEGDVEQSRAEATRRINEAAAEAERRARESARQQEFEKAKEQIARLAAEGLSAEQRIAKEREEGIERAKALGAAARSEEELAVARDLARQVTDRANRALKAIDDEKNARITAEREIADERERAAIETNERIARDMAEQMARALQDAYARGNAELLAGVNQVNSKLTVTANNILTVVRQLYANQPTGGR